MDVAYIYPPLFKPFYPMATRLITGNFSRDNRLRVHYSRIPVRMVDSPVPDEVFGQIMAKAESALPSTVLPFLRQKYIVNNLFYVFMSHGYYGEAVFEELEQGHVIVTCINFTELMIVKHLLEQGKKVVLGGPLVNIGLSPTFFRTLLAQMGVDPKRLADNLIVVSGDIDLTTDLYAMIRAWKDAAITLNDYSSFFECEDDFLHGFYRHKSATPVHFAFNSWCWYGKCRFCTYKKLPRMAFLKEGTEEKAGPYIRNVLQKFNARHIRFIDSYFRIDSPEVQRVLQEISDYHITVYSGITLLKQKKYIDFINRHMDCLLIGLETTSDFSLKAVDKGYTYKDIREAVECMTRFLDRRVFLEISLILDLPSRDEADVRENYTRVLEIKQRLEGAGFRVAVHMNILSVHPNMELLGTENTGLRLSRDPGEMAISSGKNYLIHLLKRAGMDRPSLLPWDAVIRDRQDRYADIDYGYIGSNVPVLRCDEKGKVLPSDLEIMDEEHMQAILERKARRG